MNSFAIVIVLCVVAFAAMINGQPVGPTGGCHHHMKHMNSSFANTCAAQSNLGPDCCQTLAGLHEKYKGNHKTSVERGETTPAPGQDGCHKHHCPQMISHLQAAATANATAAPCIQAAITDLQTFCNGPAPSTPPPSK